MILECKKVIHFEVKYSDLNKFISEMYDMDFNIIHDQECSNDYVVELFAEKNGLGECEKKQVAEWSKEGGKTYYLASSILCDLCDKDLVDEGAYLIDICW